MADKQYIEIFKSIIEIKRAELGYSQEKMAKELEMSLSDYKSMLNGTKSSLAIHTLVNAERLTGLNIYDLIGIVNTDLEMIKNFRSIPYYRQCAIKSMLSTEHEISKYLPVTDNVYTVPCFIPTGDMRDGMLFDSTDFQPINIAQYTSICPESIDCAIKITSNHLHPVYNIDDILLIHRNAPRDGDTGIFIHKPTSKMYIRKFRQTQPCQLIPVNGVGNIITVDSYNKAEMDEWIKYGYVLRKMR